MNHDFFFLENVSCIIIFLHKSVFFGNITTRHFFFTCVEMICGTAEKVGRKFLIYLSRKTENFNERVQLFFIINKYWKYHGEYIEEA